LNPLIKVMNLVALLILPAVISLQDNDAARFAIAGGALVILLIAIAFSKRDTGSLTDVKPGEEPVSANA
jgi:K(+)-stimulated pyrophosphate-energized sodium pump